MLYISYTPRKIDIMEINDVTVCEYTFRENWAGLYDKYVKWIMHKKMKELLQVSYQMQ